MLSIVIPTYQRHDLLRACLASLARHAPSDCEIIVVDDASPGEAARTVVEQFPDVRFIRCERRGGFAKSANVGIRASRGEIVELLNDDTEVQADWTIALNAFDDPMIGAVAPLVLIWPEARVIDSAGDRYVLAGIAGKRGHGVSIEEYPLQRRFVFGASASTGFYRRSALDKVGLFPEDFGSYFEDVDLAFRLQRAGYRTLFEPSSRILHHVSASYGTVSRRLIERQSWNEERVYWRNLPAPLLRRASLHHLGVLLAKALRRIDEGTLFPWLFGRLRILGEIPQLRYHRKELSKITVCDDPVAWGVEDRL